MNKPESLIRNFSWKFYVGIVLIIVSFTAGGIIKILLLLYLNNQMIWWALLVSYFLTWLILIWGLWWVGKEYADSVASFSGVNWEEPLRSLVVKLISEVEQRRRGSYVPIDVNGLCVTPVICNELGDFVNQYEGRPIDIIAHSASNLFTQESDRASYYCERFEKEVLAKDEVLRRLKKDYVLLYLSRDIDDIPKKFETKPVPRHYFLTSEGKIIYTTIGSRSIEGFYELLDEVKETKELK